jgi:predicted membrane protein
VASLVNVPIEGGFGDRTIQPQALRDVAGPYRLVAGRILLDLTTLPLGSGTTRISASVVAGKIEVLAPTDARVVVKGEVGAGQLDLFGRTSEGLMVRDRVAAGPRDGGRLELNLATSFGNVVVFSMP